MCLLNTHPRVTVRWTQWPFFALLKLFLQRRYLHSNHILLSVSSFLYYFFMQLKIIQEVYVAMRNEISLVQFNIITAYWEEEELWEHPLAQLVLPLLLTVTAKSASLYLCFVLVCVCIFVFLSVSLLVVIPPDRVYVGIVVRLHSYAYGSVVMTPSPTLDPIMVLETLTFLPRSVIAERGGMRESPQQRRYTLESLRQRGVSPRGYSQPSVRLLFSHTLPPLRFLPFFPLICSLVQQCVCEFDELQIHKWTCVLWWSNKAGNNLNSLSWEDTEALLLFCDSSVSVFSSSSCCCTFSSGWNWFPL